VVRVSGTYRVRVTREGGSYVADLGDLGSTFAPSLAQLDTYVREVIVLGEGLPVAAATGLDVVWDFQD
jgi:hypothetical protein